LLNSLNISSNGDPGGNLKGKGLDVVLIVCVLDIFTTEGISLSAKSAKEAGPVLLYANIELELKKTKIKAKLINFL
jgi:hypothetical protein